MAGGRWHGPLKSTPCYFQTNQAIEMITDMAKSEAPFFVSMQYWDPHGPHLIPDEFANHTDRSKIKPWASFHDELDSKANRVKRERDDFYRLYPRTEAELIDYIGLYCDHVAILDSQIGRLLAHLDAAGLRESTLIAFTSDHGDMTGSHGGLIDKGLPYEEAMRVPLVFNNPSLTAGQREGLALNMDILPTALGLLGVPFEDRQARNLAQEVMEVSQPVRENLLAEYHGLRFLCSQRVLVSDDGWKYIFSPGDYDELFDLNNDPHEMKNLAASAPYKLAVMRDVLMQETARYDDPLRDCVSKFNGQWRTGSKQFDATSAYLTATTEHRRKSKEN